MAAVATPDVRSGAGFGIQAARGAARRDASNASAPVSTSKADFVVSDNGTAVHKDTDAMRNSLSDAGFKDRDTTKPGKPPATACTIPELNKDVRAQNRTPGIPPDDPRSVDRIVGTRTNTERDFVKPRTSANFNNETTKSEHRARGHFGVDLEGSPTAPANKSGGGLSGEHPKQSISR